LTAAAAAAAAEEEEEESRSLILGDGFDLWDLSNGDYKGNCGFGRK